MRRYALTLKQAKEKSRLLIGRLPRPGHEVQVLTGYTVPVIWNYRAGRAVTRRCPATLYLHNNGGRLTLREYVSMA